MMQVGRMNEWIGLLKKSATRDDHGGEVITWVQIDRVPAEAIPLRGREFFAAQQVQSEISIKFRIRYRADVNTQWRVSWRSQQMDIIAAPDVEARRRTLELMCRTAQN